MLSLLLYANSKRTLKKPQFFFYKNLNENTEHLIYDIALCSMQN